MKHNSSFSTRKTRQRLSHWAQISLVQEVNVHVKVDDYHELKLKYLLKFLYNIWISNHRSMYLENHITLMGIKHKTSSTII